ncbi:hypothetical protein DE146DRAFT_49937 [Phaeosphaeria sp. MPI-PUGE-AT-0046c]|nr:hypothetical protein DE146DRAFT_49937 [Phaeosphaeria sp. MPI-PUGE-AT-0046c]
MNTTTETTALASNKLTPTRRASWRDGTDAYTNTNVFNHTYDASTPFLTEKNHALGASPQTYPCTPIQRSYPDIEAQGIHYTPKPKRSRSRFTTTVLWVLLFTALCALGTWVLWDGKWIGSMKHKIGELKSEVGDMEDAVRRMKEMVKVLGEYLNELRGTMLGGEGQGAGMGMGMGMGMEMETGAPNGIGQEQVTWEWQEM